MKAIVSEEIRTLSCSSVSGFIMIKKALDYSVGMKRGYAFRKQGEWIKQDAVSLQLGVELPPREKIYGGFVSWDTEKAWDTSQLVRWWTLLRSPLVLSSPRWRLAWCSVAACCFSLEVLLWSVGHLLQHPFRPTILYLWLVGWSGIYSLRPTDQSKDLVVLVWVAVIASSSLFDDHSFAEEEAKELFELRLSAWITSQSRIITAKPDK